MKELIEIALLKHQADEISHLKMRTVPGHTNSIKGASYEKASVLRAKEVKLLKKIHKRLTVVLKEVNNRLPKNDSR